MGMSVYYSTKMNRFIFLRGLFTSEEIVDPGTARIIHCAPGRYARVCDELADWMHGKIEKGRQSGASSKDIDLAVEALDRVERCIETDGDSEGFTVQQMQSDDPVWEIATLSQGQQGESCGRPLPLECLEAREWDEATREAAERVRSPNGSLGPFPMTVEPGVVFPSRDPVDRFLDRFDRGPCHIPSVNSQTSRIIRLLADSIG